MYEDRILSKALRERIMSAEDAAATIKSGMTFCTSGFGTGYPILFTKALSGSGHAKELTMINAAVRGKYNIEDFVEKNLLKKLVGFQWSGITEEAINSGKLEFVDCHLSQLSPRIRNGHFGHIDFAVIECCKINEDGSFVPGVCGGAVEAMVESADKVYLELNLAIPVSMEGIHDLQIPEGTIFSTPSQRAGVPCCKCAPDKIAAIVINNGIDSDLKYPEIKPIHKQIADNMMELLGKEIRSGAIPEDFTFQCGTGVVINCVLTELIKSGLKNLKMYTEVVGEQALMAILDGTIRDASTNALDITPSGFQTFCDEIEFLKKHLAIRTLEFSNGSAPIQALQMVSMNGAVEADIYGNINSSHAFGTHMMHGLGGSNDYCRNSKISIFSTASTAKGGAISRIVPMVSHVDNTEHDTAFIVTECGYADIRGLSPKERVREIIENCAHPDYREQLWDYYNEAVSKSGPCHTPHDLSKALSWHQRYLETGTMKK